MITDDEDGRAGPRATGARSTAGSPARRAWTPGRSRATIAGVLALGLTAAGLASLPARAIDSNPPTGPGNIEMFPKRDMVAIEGYSDYAGKTAEITVLRDDEVIGAAQGTVDGTGFLEVNHPGGVCWGAGTDLQVTPDLKGGDVVRVEFLQTGTPNRWDAATTAAVEITEVARVDAGNELVISGTYGAGVDMPGADLTADPGKMGVEIVNPDLRSGTSAVGERAIGWPQEPGEPAPAGYTVTGGVTSGTDATGGTFEVTYAFEQSTDLDLAEAGEAVALGWQAEAPPESGVEAFYGMTLYEFHEASGPGMGGCPAGPDDMRAIAPSTYTGKGAGPGSIDVTWGDGSVPPEAPALTGYSITAIRSVSTGLDAGQVVRTAADGRSATISELDAGEVYAVEVASRNSTGDSSPAVMRVRAAAHVVPEATAITSQEPDAQGKYTPLVTTATADEGVHLDPVAGVVDAEVHYTTDGSTPTTDSPTFVPGVSQSLQIRQDTTVRWLVVDGGNIVGPVGSKSFDIVEADPTTQPAPAAPSVAAADVGGAVDVSFPKMDEPDAYRIQAYTGDSADVATGVRIGSPVEVAEPATDTTVQHRVTDLVNGTSYKFSLAARYGTLWSDESVLSAAVAPEAAPGADAGPDQSVPRDRQFTLDGSGSVKVSSYQWTQVRPVDNGGFPVDPMVDLDPTQDGAQNDTGLLPVPADGKVPPVTATFPLLTTPTSDHDLLFELKTVHTDGTEGSDQVEVSGTPDTVTADEARWRDGDEIGGTGSRDGSDVLTLLDGGPTGALIGQASVTNGEWEFPSGSPELVNGTIYVWSSYGFTGSIRTTD